LTERIETFLERPFLNLTPHDPPIECCFPRSLPRSDGSKATGKHLKM
jgi:hypothetical protein